MLEDHLAAKEVLVAERIALGDQPAEPRPLDHLAHVPRRALAAACADLEAAGYRVDGVRTGLRRAAVEFSRMDPADLDTANAFTREVVALLDRHHGTYDGWGGYLVGSPPDA